MELIHVFAAIDAKVDDDARDPLRRDATPPPSERRTIKISVERRHIGFKAPVMSGPAGQRGLELHAQRFEEGGRAVNVLDEDVDRTEPGLRHG
jgi:hypothetical protein